MLKDFMEKIDADPRAIPAAEAIVASLAVAGFMAQANGLVRFPQGPMTVGEIESKLQICVDAFCAKMLESAVMDK